MTGLLKKDFYVVATLAKSYALMILIFAAMSFAGLYSGMSIVSVLLLMLLVMVPMNTFAYDEQAGWNKYAVATPAGRRGVVAGKYLLVLILQAGGLILAVLLAAIAYWGGAAEEASLMDSVVTGVVTVSTGAVINAVFLPVLFRFGVQKSRIMMVVIMGVCVGVSVGLATGFAESGLPMAAALVGVLVPLVGLVLLGVSYRISLGIYKKIEL